MTAGWDFDATTDHRTVRVDGEDGNGGGGGKEKAYADADANANV